MSELHCSITVYRALRSTKEPFTDPPPMLTPLIAVRNPDITIEASYPPDSWKLYENGRVVKEYP